MSRIVRFDYCFVSVPYQFEMSFVSGASFYSAQDMYSVQYVWR